MDCRVIVSKGRNPYTATLRGLQKFPLPDLRGRKVLVKPNAGPDRPAREAG